MELPRDRGDQRVEERVGVPKAEVRLGYQLVFGRDLEAPHLQPVELPHRRGQEHAPPG
jgi:hypothetical protein